jgi:uncharacterized integral membrane protein
VPDGRLFCVDRRSQDLEIYSTVMLLSWIIMIPTAIAVIVFAAFNRGGINVDFWPFPYAITVPLFSVVLASLLVGFCLGGLVAWVSAGRYRRQSRALARQLTAAERDLLILQDRDRRQAASPEAPAAPGSERAGDTRALPPATSATSE